MYPTEEQVAALGTAMGGGLQYLTRYWEMYQPAAFGVLGILVGITLIVGLGRTLARSGGG